MKISWVKITIVATMIISFFFISILDGLDSHHSTAFNQLIDTDQEYTLIDEILQKHEEKIRAELPAIRSRFQLQQSYYSLGFINQKRGNFNESQTYFLQALNFVDFGNHHSRFQLYREIAVNYLALDNVAQARIYFNRAESILADRPDDHLRATLYRRFATALMDHQQDVGSAVQLLKRATTFNQEAYHLIEIYLQLATIYLEGGLYELALNYLNIGFELSLSIENPHHQRLLTRLMTTHYLLDNHEEVLTYWEKILPHVDSDVNLATLIQIINTEYALNNQEVALSRLEGYEIDEEWRLLMEAQLKINGGFYEEALKKLETVNPNDGTIALWKKQLIIEITEFTQEEVIHEREVHQQLLDAIMNLDDLDLQLMFLDRLMEDLALVEDYELLHQITVLRLERVNARPRFLMNSVLDDLQYHHRRTHIIPVLVGVGSVLVGYLVYLYMKYIKGLHRTIDSQQKLDSLTQTLTHESLYSELELNITKDQYSVTFILIEVNNLGEYNKAFGYLAGDRILKELGKLLCEVFPKSFVSRHDGNQFLVATYNSKEKISNQLEMITKEVEQLEGNTTCFNEKTHLTLSIGTSEGDLKSILDIDTCIELAHEKLMISRRYGKNVITE